MEHFKQLNIGGKLASSQVSSDIGVSEAHVKLPINYLPPRVSMCAIPTLDGHLQLSDVWLSVGLTTGTKKTCISKR